MNSSTTRPARTEGEYKKLYEGSTKDGDFRKFSPAAVDKVLESNGLEMIRSHYERVVADMKANRFIPTRSSSARMTFLNYTAILKERIPVNYAKFEAAENEDAIKIGMIPWMFRCPHPTEEESNAWLLRWHVGGDLHTMCSALAPGYVFEPHFYYGTRPSDCVLIAVIMIKA